MGGGVWPKWVAPPYYNDDNDHNDDNMLVTPLDHPDLQPNGVGKFQVGAGNWGLESSTATTTTTAARLIRARSHRTQSLATGARKL